MVAQAPAALHAGIPEVVQLKPTFDVDLLVRDIEALRAEFGSKWSPVRGFIAEDNMIEIKSDWRVMPLRSMGGDPKRTDPGGPGLLPYADTSLLELTPYLKTVMRSVPSPLRSVRVMGVGPDTYGPNHFDNKYSPVWGVARLHVPVITLPEAKLIWGENEYVFPAGTFWFGNFATTHRVENSGSTTRVHLLIDVLVTESFFDLFPDDVRAGLPFENFMFNRDEQPLQPDPMHQVAFEVPKSFTDWEEEDGEFLTPQPTVPAKIEAQDGQLVLHYNGEPYAGLTYIGDNEFRFNGWTDERTVQVVDEAGQRRVVLRTRVGKQARTLAVPAEPLGE